MKYRPYKVVWEVTNACNSRCIHCGSRSGKAREGELTEAEALHLCDELKELGTEYVTLIGGEAFLCSYWDKICARLIKNGIRVSPLTNGILLNENILKRLKELGIYSIFISIDGMAKTHDQIRGIPGLFNRIVANIARAQEEGFYIGINTTVSPMNLDELPELYDFLLDLKVNSWQIQMVENIGNAAENPDLVLSLEDLYRLGKMVIKFRKNPQMQVELGDNVGYYASFAPLIRSQPFTGCAAGRFIIGIESNGNIRGCLSVESTPENTEGNVRERSLIDIWNDPNLFQQYRYRTVEKLTGFCADCEYRRLCRAGCSSLSYSLTGDFYENPFCMHRYEVEQGIHQPQENSSST